MAFWLWAGLAFAGDVHLIVGDHKERSAAEAEAALVVATGHPSRVVRRFVLGAGWRYQVRVGDFEDESSAKAAAAQLPVASSVRLVAGAGQGRSLRSASLVPASTPPDAVVPDETTNGLPAARALIRAAVKAHGGKNGGVRRVQGAKRLRFAFRTRAVVAGAELVADHTYFRSERGIRLEVDVVEGEGVSNVVVVTTTPASWVATQTEVRERDWAQASELLARFSPDSGLLSIPLGLPTDAGDAAEWRDLKTAARVDLEGVPHFLLVPQASDSTTALVEALFEVESHRLSRVIWLTRGGKVVFDYRDYRTVAENVIVPYSVRVERDGTLVQLVEVHELAIDPELRDELFTEPSVLRRKRR